MEKNIIGRIEEKKLLKKCITSPKSELVAIYGRRRVGKTFLVKELLQGQLDFYFTGIYDETKKNQLHLFSIALGNSFNNEPGLFDSWYEAFDALKTGLLELHKKRVIVFLDELPWMDTRKSEFLKAFSYFWNSWDTPDVKIKLLVCGSAATWMTDKFIGDKGGLYGRVTAPIYLAPFTLSETEEYLHRCKSMELTRMQVLDTYMILGGIPYYLDMLDNTVPISTNIDQLFFSKQAVLRNEFDLLFRSLFKNSLIYKKIINALAQKSCGMSKQELIKTAQLTDNGCLTQALQNLASCDFIQKYTSIGKKDHDALYRLIDPFSLFYLRFVSPHNGQDEHFWSNSAFSGEINAWKGYMFETVCLQHVAQIKKALGISGILSNVHAWYSKPFEDSDGTKWNGGQIDLLIDRRDGVIDIAEVKYSSGQYIITSEYATKIQNRSELFRHVTKTKKALHIIFITTCGVKPNKYSSIMQNQLVLDDLFE